MKTAFLFPGQGSQSVGMLQDIAADFPVIQQYFRQASDVLGYDLWEVVKTGPADKLNQTAVTQPAMLTADVALYDCWQQHHDLEPLYLAGHSLGEYAALVCAEAISFTDAVALVAKRGEYMQAAVPSGEGAMAAIIGLDEATVLKACEQSATGEVVSPANYNSIGQTVIAGTAAAVDLAVEAAKSLGAKIAKRIPVSVPSHCQLMLPAQQQLAAALATVSIQSPKIPVIHNVNVMTTKDPDEIRDWLALQLTTPVQWVKTIQHLLEQDVFHALECGPGKVLAGLNKRINKTFITRTITSCADITAPLV